MTQDEADGLDRLVVISGMAGQTHRHMERGVRAEAEVQAQGLTDWQEVAALCPYCTAIHSLESFPNVPHLAHAHLIRQDAASDGTNLLYV